MDIIGFDGWEPGVGCITVIIPYEFTFQIGPLEIGRYTLLMTEYHQSIRDPNPQVRMVRFHVVCGDVCGDANCDGRVNVGDAVFVIAYVFNHGPSPEAGAGDANGDGDINIGDGIYLINFVFRDGLAPDCP